MNLNPELLEILACPACKSPLRADDAASELVCDNPDCGLAYAVRDDIPVLLVEEARRPGEGEDAGEASTDEAGRDGETASAEHSDGDAVNGSAPDGSDSVGSSGAGEPGAGREHPDEAAGEPET